MCAGSFAGWLTMVAIRLAQPLELHPQDVDKALERLLAETREGPVSVIGVPAQCLVRMVRRRDATGLLGCVLAWEPIGPDMCSFIGSLSIVNGAPRDALTLVLEGTAQPARLRADPR